MKLDGMRRGLFSKLPLQRNGAGRRRAIYDELHWTRTVKRAMSRPAYLGFKFASRALISANGASRQRGYAKSVLAV